MGTFKFFCRKSSKMRIIQSLLLAFAAARVTTRNGGRYQLNPANVDEVPKVDDYGYEIERTYDTDTFYQGNDESESFVPDFDQVEEQSSEVTVMMEITTTEGVPVIEPYINSKYDPNRVWLNQGSESEWTPDETDNEQLEYDIKLDLNYE